MIVWRDSILTCVLCFTRCFGQKKIFPESGLQSLFNTKAMKGCSPYEIADFFWPLPLGNACPQFPGKWLMEIPTWSHSFSCSTIATDTDSCLRDFVHCHQLPRISLGSLSSGDAGINSPRQKKTSSVWLHQSPFLTRKTRLWVYTKGKGMSSRVTSSIRNEHTSLARLETWTQSTLLKAPGEFSLTIALHRGDDTAGCGIGD
ncbi:uncharacterized protein EV420DRAFT_885136 [Desarmillaria tabescens]|uniref:Uncharacterized protein n=1 Tax=Armillaria tabescens TaxID=1929756 RepID=A0AA39JQC7_ARMTA|nr:uncharacterized protein EV420DRAFT_885136 [Desarmillaria tabescens]KAK0446980.1 hypothetical protein EV420DRAFT_885136 [Desarmillaria tabescens]